jgi:oligopeptide transport system substrate-binding protein
MRARLQIILLSTIFGYIMSCSNNPYPYEHKSGNVFYTDTSAPPKNLDPQHTYTMVDLGFLKLCYDPLLDYGYLDQMSLKPALSKKVPVGKVSKNEKGEVTEVRYTFDLREGVRFIDDECFKDGKGRELTAKDFEYAFKRASDSEVNCPIFNQLAFVKGYGEYRKAIDQKRKELQEEFKKENGREFDPKKDYIKSFDLYKETGPLEGIEVTGKYTFDMILSRKYPQILYWLAMRFICGVPHEGVDFYNPSRSMTSQVPVNFDLRPVGTGPYRILWEEFRKDQKVIMVKNENWWGNRIAGPTTRFPDKPHNKEDVENKYWTKEAAGKSIAQMDRIEWYYEKESLTRFSKFLQGYYDINLVPAQKVSEVLAGQGLSEDMKSRGIQLNRDVEMSIRYIGFNMNNDEIGAPKKFKDPELERNREKTLERNKYLRQAMSLAIDMDEYIRVHMKGMGMNAQNILPPGIFGYNESYKNPYKYTNTASLDKARALLAKAGYKNGIDQKTKEALKLEFTCSIKSAGDTARYNFFIDCWNKIGIDVKLDGMEYNQFQNKVYEERAQIFVWGWHADYPDPENFLFLLVGDNAPNPNHTSYSSSRFDKYFRKLEIMTNDESTEVEEMINGKKTIVTMTRLELIHKCMDIAADESPWIFMYFDVQFLLYHSWMQNVKTHPLFTYPFHYYRLNKAPRTEARSSWNTPVIWPAYVLILTAILFFLPAIRTYIKERN